MTETIKNILKWAIVIVLGIIVILLIVQAANRGSKTNKQTIKPVENIKIEKPANTTDEENTENTLIVDSKDTGVDSGVTPYIGIILLAGTTYYIIRKRPRKDS